MLSPLSDAKVWRLQLLKLPYILISLDNVRIEMDKHYWFQVFLLNEEAIYQLDLLTAKRLYLILLK